MSRTVERPAVRPAAAAARPDPRTLAAVLAGKAVGAASRALGRGGGTALPGVVSERIQPALVARLAQQIGAGTACVTGTNGKTTTARMVAAMARHAGYLPVHNRSGSNLMRGLAATLVAAVGPTGRLPDAGRRLGVLEVDEATLPQAAAALRPRAVAVTNLFRDQLDRYGEVDSIAALWRRTLDLLPEETALVLNADDPLVASLGGRARGPVLYYGVDDAACALATPEHAADSRWCGTCGAEYGYRVNFYGHVGHWYCPGCGAARPEPQVRATRVTLTPEGGAAQVETPAGPLDVRLGLAGLYSVYNALAAAATGLALGLPPEAVQEGLSGVTAAFGRQERIPVWGRTVRVLLCKNPAGTNQVLRTVLADPEAVRVLLVLNDGIADGEDVSWIWDVDFELLAGRVEDVWAGGIRAADMGLRLKYAGLGDRLRAVERDVDAVLRAAVEATPPGGTLYVLPTYTAMLHVRERLAGWGNLGHYWEEE